MSGWLGPVGPPRSVGAAAWTLSTHMAGWYRGAWWILGAVVAGVVPLLCSYALTRWGWSGGGHQLASGYALALLLLGAAHAGAGWRGVATIGVGFLSHCVVAVAISARDPAGAAACMPGGVDYWERQRAWITTGEDPENDVWTWLPAHAGLAVVVVVSGYLSLGMIPLARGFYEVDLMNFYVGQLLPRSTSSVAAVGWGWHLWSLVRGVAYALVLVEVVAWSLERLSGRPLPAARARKWRWWVGLSGLALDCAIKYSMLDAVRGQLDGNLR